MADGSHVGRPSSWIAVGVMVAGFTIGGLGLVFGPTWWVFWTGGAIVMIGGVLALAVGVFSDVVVDPPRDIAAVEATPADQSAPAAPAADESSALETSP